MIKINNVMSEEFVSTIGSKQGTYLELVKQMYRDTKNMIKINNVMSEEFVSTIGSKQGDPSSPTHFNVFINDSLHQLKDTGLGVDIGDPEKVCVLAYADDIMLLAENERDLQSLMDVIASWCSKWQLAINPAKTNVVHFRPRAVKETLHKFYVGVHDIKVQSYKYLGVILDCFCRVEPIIEQLAGTGSRALGTVLNKSKDN